MKKSQLYAISYSIQERKNQHYVELINQNGLNKEFAEFRKNHKCKSNLIYTLFLRSKGVRY